MKKKVAAAVLVLAVLAVAVHATEKAVHRVRVTQVNEWQAIVSCRNGRTPSVNKEAIAGVLVISCEGREE